MPFCFVHPLTYQPDPSVYLSALADAPGAVLLDSGRPGAKRGHYDLLSAWPRQVFAPEHDESASDFFHRLRAALAGLGPAQPPADRALPFCGGLIGFLGYDFGRRIERLPEQATADISILPAQLGLYDWALITDHAAAESMLVFHPTVAPERRLELTAFFEQVAHPVDEPFRLSAPFRAEMAIDAYRAAIARTHGYIRAGDCYQINFAQRFHAPYEGSAVSAYRRMRMTCPTPFSGYLQISPTQQLLSLSPERFIRVSQGRVETRPIKGTRPRGATPAEDEAQIAGLRTSEKDRAENLMIVDLLRNDLGRSCLPGSISVPELFSVETYPNVHHLVSSVQGRLPPERDAFDVLLAAFPGGSITGAPKIRAMQIIDELEPTRRTVYCGSLLYVDVRGEMDSSITIRSVLMDDGTAYCWGGGGIVADSDWHSEYQESLTKVRVLMSTLERPPA